MWKVAPSEIVEPGVYFFDEDRDGSITIASSEVTLELHGKSLIGKSGPVVATTGISIVPGVSKIAIRGGTIVGHHYGVRADDVADLTIDSVTFSGQSFRVVRADGQYLTICNSRFRSIGGTDLYSDAYAMAIELNGPNCIVDSNVVLDVFPVNSGEGVGILLGYDCDNSLVSRNVVANSGPPESGRTFGIWSSSRVARLKDNIISMFTYGVEGYNAEDNLLIDVAGNSYLGLPSSDFRAATGRPNTYPDDYHRTSRKFDPADRNHNFRMAQIHSMAKNFILSYAYFTLAAGAGSKEAEEEAVRMISNGLVTQGEVGVATKLAPLLQDHHQRQLDGEKT